MSLRSWWRPNKSKKETDDHQGASNTTLNECKCEFVSAGCVNKELLSMLNRTTLLGDNSTACCAFFGWPKKCT